MFSAQKTQKYGVVLFIEAGGASALIIESDREKEAPAIVYAAQKRATRNLDLAHLKDLLRGLASDVELHGQKALALRNPKAKITEAVTVCTPPWSATIAHVVEFEGKTPFTIDAKLLKDLQKAAEEQAAENPEEHMVLGTNNFEVVERAIVDTKINGYDIDEPLGVEGQSLSLTEVTSLVSKEAAKIIEEACERMAPSAKTEFATNAFASYRVLRDVYPSERSFCFVHASSEITEIGIVEKDALLSVTHVAYGTETLLRAICEEQNASTAHIRSQICLHQEGLMDDDALREMESHFGEYTAEIKRGFESLAKKHPIPRQLFVVTASSFENILRQKILEAVQQAHGQAHALVENVALLQGQNGTVSEAVLGRYFHKLHLENRL